jgi:hypothetical protein
VFTITGSAGWYLFVQIAGDPDLPRNGSPDRLCCPGRPESVCRGKTGNASALNQQKIWVQSISTTKSKKDLRNKKNRNKCMPKMHGEKVHLYGPGKLVNAPGAPPRRYGATIAIMFCYLAGISGNNPGESHTPPQWVQGWREGLTNVCWSQKLGARFVLYPKKKSERLSGRIRFVGIIDRHQQLLQTAGRFF